MIDPTLIRKAFIDPGALTIGEISDLVRATGDEWIGELLLSKRRTGAIETKSAHPTRPTPRPGPRPPMRPMTGAERYTLNERYRKTDVEHLLKGLQADGATTLQLRDVGDWLSDPDTLDLTPRSKPHRVVKIA